MRRYSLIFYLIAFILLIPPVLSCRKFVGIPPPTDKAETIYVFESESGAISAVVGLYSQMMLTTNTICNGSTTIYPALSADELYNTAPSADYDAFRTNEIPETATGLNRIWSFGYRFIYHANAVIDGLERSLTLSDSLKHQLKGEMLVTRAFLHGLLTNMFGELPIITGTDYEVNQGIGRSPVTEVYEQIIADLSLAKSLLKESYPSTGKVRPNKWVAVALLARAYLYTGNWNAAAQESTALINSGQYSLPANLNNVFLTTSTEAIWQLSPVITVINTAEGNLFNPVSASSRPNFALTSSLLTAFEPNDMRKTNWTKTVTVSGQPYTYPYKYKVRAAPPPYTEYNMCVRLAEMYLVRAEARAMMNDIMGASEDINRIRTRAGLGNTTANSQSTLLNAIEQERRIEFMIEFGHRWFDLKRTGRAHAVLAPLKAPTWAPTDVLYPLQQYDLETNPVLYQNPGY